MPAPRPAITRVVTSTTAGVAPIPPRYGETARYGETIRVEPPNPLDIAQVVLVRPGAPTHAFDFEQRVIGLQFNTRATWLDLAMPADVTPNGLRRANVAPPGYYMLFLINRARTPSVAAFVQLAPNPPNQPPRGNISPDINTIG